MDVQAKNLKVGQTIVEGDLTLKIVALESNSEWMAVTGEDSRGGDCGLNYGLREWATVVSN